MPRRPSRVTAKDAYGNTDTGYSGAKSLTYSGASSSTNPVTAPTVTNSTPAAIGFGSGTTNTFTNGVSNTAGGVGSMTLYKAEAATIAVTDGTLERRRRRPSQRHRQPCNGGPPRRHG